MYELETDLAVGSIDTEDLPSEADAVVFEENQMLVEDYWLARALVDQFGIVHWEDEDPGPPEGESEPEPEDEDEDTDLDLPEDPGDLDECPWCEEYTGDNVGQHAGQAHPDEWADAYGE